MYLLKILGTRRSTLAYHYCDSLTEVNELLSVYRALGYADSALLVEERTNEKVA